VILSLCDYSGVWSGAFRELGFTTIQVDPKLTKVSCVNGQIQFGCTVQEFKRYYLPNYSHKIVGILMAPPCTHFSRSGALYWPEKDMNGKTEAGLEIVDVCLSMINKCKNLRFWCLENPIGRLGKLRPLGAVYTFQPCEFTGLADDPEWEAYSKRTCLWGKFTPPIKELAWRRLPTDKSGFGELLRKSGRDEEATKELRSLTPQGFSRAFAMAQVNGSLKGVSNGK
jgi:hypothetical protein